MGELKGPKVLFDDRELDKLSDGRYKLIKISNKLWRLSTQKWVL